MGNISEIIKAGGIILIALSCISVYSIAIILERWFTFRKISKYYAGLRKQMTLFLRTGDISSVRDFCTLNDSPTSAIILSLMRSRASKSEKREFAGRASDKYITDISSRISILATIGSVSPFVGLFGTVLGVMRAFRDLSAASGAGPSVVALGISEALVNTAAGLFVAVPAVVFYNWFANRANDFSSDLNWFAEQLIESAPDAPKNI
ncbi:MAG: MotA/TolQ/ExbB proton channel family protein [Elusimicrobiales bacterium]|nr:MotA/TolQ/ExbB proton channel family protein [Elusimicrobiales bacterium]